MDYTIGHLMMDQLEDETPKSLKSYIKSRDGVDFIPASIYLSVADAKFRTEMGAEQILVSILNRVKNNYDFILIDTCPSVGMKALVFMIH